MTSLKEGAPFLLTLILFIGSCARAAHAGKLNGRVALVTGASRGIGKGIALGLAESGATVYITGRSIGGIVTEEKLGGSLEECVKEINALGGKGIAVACDHRKDEEVKAVFDRIEKEAGRLDILVNNAFQVPSRPDGSEDPELLFRDFWEQPGWFWDAFNIVGLRSHYIASVYAVPLLKKTKELGSSSALDAKPPLIVHVSSFGGVSYSFNVAYGVGKAGVDRMAKDMHRELKPLGIGCISLYPGVVRTERMREILDGGAWQARTGLASPAGSVETPRLSGRVVAALYDDADGQLLSKRSGGVCVTAEVAKEFNIPDISGQIPPSIRSLKYLVPAVILGKMKDPDPKLEEMLLKYVPDILLPMSFMEGGAPDQ